MATTVGTMCRDICPLLGITALAAPFVSAMMLFDPGIATTSCVIAGIILVATSRMKAMLGPTFPVAMRIIPSLQINMRVGLVPTEQDGNPMPRMPVNAI